MLWKAPHFFLSFFFHFSQNHLCPLMSFWFWLFNFKGQQVIKIGLPCPSCSCLLAHISHIEVRRTNLMHISSCPACLQAILSPLMHWIGPRAAKMHIDPSCRETAWKSSCIAWKLMIYCPRTWLMIHRISSGWQDARSFHPTWSNMNL